MPQYPLNWPSRIASQEELEKFFAEGEPTPVMKEEPVCECGGEKCKLPHSRWCPMYKEVKKK